MKKILALTIAIASIGVFTAEAKAETCSALHFQFLSGQRATEAPAYCQNYETGRHARPLRVVLNQSALLVNLSTYDVVHLMGEAYALGNMNYPDGSKLIILSDGEDVYITTFSAIE